MLGWTTSSDTATSGDDYTAVTAGTLTISAGDTTGTLTVSTAEDLLAEADETFRVTITGTTLPSGVSLDTATATGTIEDDDTLTAEVTAGASTVPEGSAASFEVALTGATSTAAVVVTYTVTGTATPGTDYTAPSGSLTIAAGMSSATIAVQTTSDTVLDLGETLIVTLTGASTAVGTAEYSPTVATTTITDPGTATVSVADARAAEGDDVEFTVELSLAAGSDTVLGWTTVADTATSGDDYTAVTSGALTVAAGDTTGTLTVSTEEDLLAEDDETFRVTITGTTLPSGVSLDTATATGTIEDDDTLTAEVTAGASTVPEGSAASFEVALTGATSTAAVVVTYTVTGTATPGTDYTAPSGSLTIAAGMSSATIAVQTTSDTVLDLGETLIVTLTGASTAVGTAEYSRTAATTMIADPGTATVSVADVRATEGDDVEFTVTLSIAAGSDTVLGWTTAAVTATSGDDFTAVTSGTLTIAAGATTGTLTVSTEEDLLAEDDETFRVTITGTTLPSGVTLDTATATGTIEDDDTLTAEVTAGASTVPEGSAAEFTVTLTSATSTALVVVTYSVTGTATSGTDYTAPSGSLTITAGASSTTITIRTTPDSVLDSGETLTVTLTGASTPAGTAEYNPTAATTTITDPGTATVSVADVRAAEGDDVEFTVTLSIAVGSDTVLGWTTTAGSATSGDDFTAVTSGTLTIAAGATTGTLTVSTAEDLLAEADETFTVTITGTTLPSGVTLGTATATGTIEDDDTLTAAVTAGASTVPEGSVASFEVALTGATSTADVVVTYAVTGTATPGTDYTAPDEPLELTITAGASSAMITIQTSLDSVLDTGETLIVTLTGASTAGTVTVDSTVATTTIVDSGTATVSVAAVAGTVAEGTVAQFTVTLSGAVGSDLALGWSTAGGTATAGADYLAVSGGTVTLTAGTTRATIEVAVADDTLAESDETFTVILAAPGNGLPAGVSLGTTTATGTIEDNDPIKGTVAGAETVVEGTTAEFTVTLTNATSTAPVVVSYKVGGTATSGTDYTAPATPATLTIAAGVKTGTISIQTLDDGVLDPGEALTVTLSSATTMAGAVTVDSTAATTAITDPGMVTVSVAAVAATVTEGTTAEFTVTLSGAVASDVALRWSIADGTAIAGEDYIAVSGGTVTLSAGTTSTTIEVAVTDDTLAESDETFTVILAAPGTGLPARVSLGTTTATGTIEDNDPIKGTVAGAETVVEGTTAEFTVTLTSATSTAPVVVSYTVGGTATSGTDYTAPATPATLALAAGAKTGTISIPILDDGVRDPGETLTVTLRSATTMAGTVTVDSTAATTAIADPGMVTASVAAVAATVAEGTVAEFTVTLSGAVGSDVALGWSTAGGTATAGEDYTAVSGGTVTLSAGTTRATIEVAVTDDTLAESDETFMVTLAAPGTGLPAGVSLGTTTATGTIEDNETLEVSVAAVAGPVTEGLPAEFTVTLTGGVSTAAVVVSYTVGGTAMAGDDYTLPATPATLTLAAGAATGTISIPTLTDQVRDPGETLTVTLRAATTMAGTVTVDATAATTTIADTATVADSVTVSLAAGSAPEGEAVAFTVTLSGAVGSDVALDWSTADGTATAGADYAAVSDGTVTFVAGGPLTQTISVRTLDDAVAEENETFTVTLAAASGTGLPAGVGLGPAAATGTIEDDDERGIVLRPAVLTVREGERGTWQVVLASEPTATTTIAVSSQDRDVTVDPARLTFTPSDWNAVQTVTVRVADRDGVAEDAPVRISHAASGADYASVTATLVVTILRPEGTSIATAWLARSGRTIAQHVLAGLQERLRAPREAGFEGTLAGRVLDTSGAGWRDGRLPARADGREDGWRDARPDEPVRSDEGTLTLRDLVTGSAFRVGAGSDETAFGEVWGQGAHSIVGGTEADLRLDGEVTTGTVGADYQRGRWTGGAALSHSEANADYRSDAEEGRVGVSLTGVYPYAGYAVTDRVSVWGAGGYGEGDLQVKPDEGERANADIRLTMAAAGLRGTLAARPDGLEAAVKADVLYLRMSSLETAELEAAEGRVGRVRVGRVRLGLEGAKPFALDNGASVAPELEVGVRHDGGDAETGFGVDLGAGLRWSAPGPRLSGELDVRGLLVHEDEEFEEWTVSGAVRHAPATPSGRGLSYSLTRSWGAPGAGGGADRLWARETLSGMGAGGGGDSGGRLEAEAGYGFPVLGGRFTGTPHVGLGVSDAGRDYRFGYRLDLVGGEEARFGLGIEARVPDGAGRGARTAEPDFRLTGTLRW